MAVEDNGEVAENGSLVLGGGVGGEAEMVVQVDGPALPGKALKESEAVSEDDGVKDEGAGTGPSLEEEKVGGVGDSQAGQAMGNEEGKRVPDGAEASTPVAEGTDPASECGGPEEDGANIDGSAGKEKAGGAAALDPNLKAEPRPPGAVDLYVSHLPKVLTAQELRAAFEQAGVEVLNVHFVRHKQRRPPPGKDGGGGRHQGTAFVTVASAADAEKAIGALHGKQPYPAQITATRPMLVSRAKERAANKPPAGRLLAFSNLKGGQPEVRLLLDTFGTVQLLTLERGANGTPAGTGTVRYVTRSEAEAAVAGLHGKHKMPDAAEAVEVQFVGLSQPVEAEGRPKREPGDRNGAQQPKAGGKGKGQPLPSGGSKRARGPPDGGANKRKGGGQAGHQQAPPGKSPRPGRRLQGGAPQSFRQPLQGVPQVMPGGVPQAVPHHLMLSEPMAPQNGPFGMVQMLPPHGLMAPLQPASAALLAALPPGSIWIPAGSEGSLLFPQVHLPHPAPPLGVPEPPHPGAFIPMHHPLGPDPRPPVFLGPPPGASLGRPGNLAAAAEFPLAMPEQWPPHFPSQLGPPLLPEHAFLGSGGGGGPEGMHLDMGGGLGLPGGMHLDAGSGQEQLRQHSGPPPARREAAVSGSVAAAVQAKLAAPFEEGPPGANLCVHHIPPEFQDDDLAAAFAPFGSVVSARVFVRKATGESAEFGFVSFDSAGAAQAAIEVMNGFQLGPRRLRVALARERRKPKAQ